VIVNPPPVARLPPAGPLFLRLRAPGYGHADRYGTSGKTPYTTQWSNGATTATTSVSPSSGTTYTVTVTDALGCKSTASVR
jgi:hypothetical protein